MQNETLIERALRNTRPGDKIRYIEEDGGSFSGSAEVHGPNVEMSGDDIDSNVDLGVPQFSLEDGTGSEGGSFLSGFSGDSVSLPSGVVMPLVIAGIALIVGAGVLAWQRMFKAAGYAALAGAALIVMGQSMLWGVLILLALAVVVLWPLISAELEQTRLRQITKPIMTGIEKTKNDNSRKEVKANIKGSIDPKAETIIEKYKKKWNI